jgi:hypothetical protein
MRPTASATPTRRIILIAAVGLGISACGGGSGGSGTGTPPLSQSLPPGVAARESLFDAASGRLSARSNTAFVAPFIEGMPSDGTATYEGILFVELDTAALATELYGVARVSADFKESTMSGGVTNFFGTDRNGSEAPYTGSVALSNGDIGVTRPNDFDLDYNGSLNGNGEIVLLSGTLDGDFKADPIRGILARDTSPTANIGGTPVTGRLSLAAEVVR